jgi:hypothetical protein
MLHFIHAINPAPLNAIMPRLQQMADDPAFPERRRHRFNEDDPPPPYSSGSTTELPTPNLFPPVADNDVDVDELLRKPLNDEEINWFGGKVRYYRPHHRYYDEFSQERRRIDREWGGWDESFKRVYRGPDLTGLSGQQRLRIMVRHSIKKRWERLGVWNPEWRIPTYIDGGHTDTAGNWAWKWDREQSYTGREDDDQRYEMRMVSWPSREEELPDERAVRLHLERQGVWTETHGPQPLETDGPIDVHVDHRELLITSRPWFVWNLEVAEEEVRLHRDPKNSDIYYRARENVTARWKGKEDWKDSWGDLPGWKWRHESASPEPADPNDMDFTPSEIDALEEIPPPTPPTTPISPWSLYGATIFSSFLSRENNNPAPPASTQTTLKPHVDGDGDHEGNRPETTAAPMDEDTYTTPCAEYGALSSLVGTRRRDEVRGDDRNNYEQQRRPTTRRLTRSATRQTRSTTRIEKASPVIRRTRLGKNASPALTPSSKISKPTPGPRRSARIAGKEAQLKGTGVPPETVKAIDAQDAEAVRALQPLKGPKQQKKKSSTRATTRKKDRTRGRYPPTSSKPQGITKRRGRSRSSKLNA